MARIRNPRFAPEFLESRLSPSSFGIAPRTVEVSTFVAPAPLTVSQEPLPTDADGDPIPDLPSDNGPGQPGGN